MIFYLCLGKAFSQIGPQAEKPFPWTMSGHLHCVLQLVPSQTVSPAPCRKRRRLDSDGGQARREVGAGKIKLLQLD